MKDPTSNLLFVINPSAYVSLHNCATFWFFQQIATFFAVLSCNHGACVITMCVIIIVNALSILMCAFRHCHWAFSICIRTSCGSASTLLHAITIIGAPPFPLLGTIHIFYRLSLFIYVFICPAWSTRHHHHLRYITPRLQSHHFYLFIVSPLFEILFSNRTKFGVVLFRSLWALHRSSLLSWNLSFQVISSEGQLAYVSSVHRQC